LNIWAVIIELIVGIIILAPVLWISGRLLAGKEKAKFTDALWIVVLGIVIGMLVNYFLSGPLASVIMLIVWLALIKHFFDCGWIRALIIAIVAVIIFVIIAAILLVIGIGLFRVWI